MKQRRKALDLTQQALAQQVGCSPSLVFKIESDGRRPSRQIAELLADVLKIPPDQRDLFLRVARQEKGVDHLEPIRPVIVGPPARVIRPYPSNLPVPFSPLIGREHELRAIIQRIQDPACRLLTLTGPGGVGKTRLALEVAYHLRDSNSEYASYFVSLEGTNLTEFIIPAVAGALGFVFSGALELKTQLFHFLKDKRVLLVLDNLEHLLDGIEVLDELLESAPHVKLLTTSREQLNLRTEWVVEVQGLPVPEHIEMDNLEANSAAALFIQRARRINVNFTPVSADLPEITRICQLVDGLPLGLELAATWVRLMSLSEIVREIERSVDFLTTNARDVPQRHRSIRAVFDHSWGLLTEAERLAMQSLAVFRGGFTRDAAEKVAGADLALLLALVDKSLVRRGRVGRYDIHELIRQYAISHLQSDGQHDQMVHARHAQYFLGLLADSEYPLRSERQRETLDALKPEIDNIRVAWNFAAAVVDLERLRGATGTLYYFYELQQFFREALEAFRRAADSVQRRMAQDEAVASAAERARLLGALADLQTREAFFHQRLGKNLEALELYRINIARLDGLDEPLTTAYAYIFYGIVTQAVGDYTESKKSLVHGLPLAHPLPHPWLEVIGLSFLGCVEHAEGRFDEAYTHLSQAMALCEQMKDPYISLLIGTLFSPTAQKQGRFAQAKELIRDSLRIARESNNLWAIGLGLEQMAAVEQAAGQAGEARRMLAESAGLHREIGDLWSQSRVLEALSRLELAMGDLAAAKVNACEAVNAAVEGQFYANGLDALATLAGVYARQGQDLRALEGALVVLNQSASTWDARERAEMLRAEIEPRLSAGEVDAARCRVMNWTLATIAREWADG